MNAFMPKARQPAAAPPAAPEPVRIPQPDDPDLIAARKRKVADEFATRQGRASTRLAQPNSGEAYGRTTLG